MLSKIMIAGVIAVALAACQSTWTDPSTLPSVVSVCGLNWESSPAVTMTRQEAREQLGREPIVFDPRSPLCPGGACTAHDPAGPQRDCQENLWAQVGVDQ